MRYRLFGQTGLRVSELFLGTMSFSRQPGGTPPEEARRILDLYADHGGNVIDTAVTYRDGQSEDILGELLEGRRDRFVVTTKYTLTRDPSDPNAAGNHRKNMRLSLETSLRRLRTDHIDVYWVHLWDRHTPMQETMRALDDAVRDGKILYIGISDTPAWVVAHANTLAQWQGWTPFAGLQVPYSLIDRDIERELLPMAETFGMTVATWGPLAHGRLTARPSDATTGSHLTLESLTPREHAIAQEVRAVAEELGATPAQVAIAWNKSRSRTIHPILGARTAEQLRDNLGALDLTLPDEALHRLTTTADVRIGFPGDFIDQASQWAFGQSGDQLDGR